MEGLRNLGLEKSLSVRSSADDGALAREISEKAKTLPGFLCEESVVLVS